MRELNIGDTILTCGFHTIDEAGNWRYLNGLEEILLSLYSKGLGDNNGFHELALGVEDIIVSIEEVSIKNKCAYDVIEHDVTGLPYIDFGYTGRFTDKAINFCHLTYQHPKDELPLKKGNYRWTLKGNIPETPMIALLKERGLPYAMYDLELFYSYITNLLTADLVVAFRKEKSDLLHHIAQTLKAKQPEWSLKYLSDCVQIRKK